MVVRALAAASPTAQPASPAVTARRRPAPVAPTGSFVLNLELWRQQLNLQPGAFAAYLGISRSQYAKLRQGTRRAGAGLIARVLKERPDFYPYVASEFTRL